MRLSILHETKYRYATPANYTIQYLRLSPQTTVQQTVLNWKLDLPGPAKAFLDGFGNTAHVLVIDKPTARFAFAPAAKWKWRTSC